MSIYSVENYKNNLEAMPVSGKMAKYVTAIETPAGNSSPATPGLSEEEIAQQLDTVDNGVKSTAFLSQKAAERAAANREALQESEYAPVDFKQAIKDYWDEMVTGLTEEEIKIIDAEVAMYLRDNPGDTEGALALKKALMKKFGFKGDLEGITVDVFMGALDVEGTEQQTADVNKAIDAQRAPYKNLTTEPRV